MPQPEHITINVPHGTVERAQILLADRLRKNPQQRAHRQDVIVDAINIGFKVMEAGAFSGIQLLISKEIL